MRRIIAFLYGVAAYVVFLGTFLYAIGFVGNVGISKSVDAAAEESFSQALLINILLAYSSRFNIVESPDRSSNGGGPHLSRSPLSGARMSCFRV